MCQAEICKTQTSENGAAVVTGLMKLVSMQVIVILFSKSLSYILTGGVKVYKLANKWKKKKRLCKRIGE